MNRLLLLERGMWFWIKLLCRVARARCFKERNLISRQFWQNISQELVYSKAQQLSANWYSLKHEHLYSWDFLKYWFCNSKFFLLIYISNSAQYSSWTLVFYCSKSTSQPLLHNAKFDNNSNMLHVIYSFCNVHSKIFYLIFLIYVANVVALLIFPLKGTLV